MKKTPLKRGTKRLRARRVINMIQEGESDWDKMKDFFMQVWRQSEHVCESCGANLGQEPKSYMFDHLLEKSKYPELALDWENIYLCCFDCHSKKTNGHPTEAHQKAILGAKIYFGL